MAKKITDIVTWVGKTDWELNHFHGDELSTSHGSSYNAYLIQDTKTALTEIFRSKAVLFGSPTINYGISFAMAGIMEMVHGMKFKNKKAASFGSYGWSGEAVKILTDLRHFGTSFAQSVKENTTIIEGLPKD